MRSVNKLMLIAGLGRGAFGRWRLQRMLSILAATAALAVAAAALIGVAVVGGFYVLYLLLIDQGFGILSALAVTSLAALAATLALCLSIRRRLREAVMAMNTPAGEAWDAFLDGLLARNR